jgi:hypothetical protein
MAASPEAEVMLALVSVLSAGLAGAPPGDWSYLRPPVVRRAPLPPPGTQMKKDECPVVYVVPGQGSQMSPGDFDMAAQSVAYRYDFNVDVIGIVFRDATTDVLADDERLNLRRHVIHVLLENRHLGGLSKDGLIVGLRPEVVDEGDLAPAALFGLPVTVPLAQSYATPVAA